MEFTLLVLTALWLGILTSISPCPLASNIAAVSYLSLNHHRKGGAVAAGFIYSLGRATAYILIAFVVVQSLTQIHVISDFLQRYLNKILGFVLILAGMFMAGLIDLRIPSFSLSVKTQKKLAGLGFIGPFFMGMLFALALCPVAAAIFFGTLIPLCVKSGSALALPAIYGLGTGLPVMIFAFIISLGAKALDEAYGKVKVFETWALKITGIIFIIAGIYYILNYVLNLL
jgi:cytochrome c-type biogenesis protein